ncbi:hypothetical protein G3446_02880 [Thiorhodococcus minor]|uniref:Uncharacterized protein n=2 Tax=Thiorhodococcus minor TaxID=57489 RepID=A0A6M0JUL7_9GAMM|nr:hypothetical protein [Thiorhodococcus minor]
MAWILAGCSGTAEDVRIRLCKDLVIAQLPGAARPAWAEADVEMRRSEELVVLLSFDARGAGGKAEPMRATCHYRHDAVDDTALTLANPAAAYSTSPYRMTLNGESIGNPRLARAIKQAMTKQGRELLEKAQKGIDDAARAIEGSFGGGEGR